MLAAATDIWRYQAHPEVWILMAGAVGIAYYVLNVLGPKAVPEGQPIVSTKNKVTYVAGIVALWVASDWPMHDISEEYLYSAHMVQHLIISLIVPPLLLAAMPEWLARLIVSRDGRSGVWVRRMAHPVLAGVLFNAVTATTHVKVVVNTSIEVGAFHYLVHLVVFFTAVLMWIPVISPLPELRMKLPGQMIYLFLMSVLPTVPGAWLTFAEGALYEVYDHDVRLWGINVSSDQQAAGLIMKVAGGFYLWGWITFRFYQWSGEDEGGALRPYDKSGRPLPGSVVDVRDHAADADGDEGLELTFEEVQSAFEQSEPPGTDPLKMD